MIFAQATPEGVEEAADQATPDAVVGAADKLRDMTEELAQARRELQTASPELVEMRNQLEKTSANLSTVRERAERLEAEREQADKAAHSKYRQMARCHPDRAAPVTAQCCCTSWISCARK